MKTQILIFFISVLSLSAFASGNPTTNTEKSKSLVVETSQWKSEFVKVQIRETSGAVIFDETLKNTRSLRRYNINNLPNGKYVLEVSNDLRLTTQDFIIESNDVIMSKDINTVFKPVMTWNNNNLDLNLMTLGKKASISIADKDSNVLFAEKLDSPVVHKRYDISDLPAGEYSVTIEMGGRYFVSYYTK